MPLKRILLTVLLMGSPVWVLAADEHYAIDSIHTYPSLEFNHMGISVWRGKFTKTSGSITLDLAAHAGSVQVTVDTASIDFGLPVLDERARSEDYFDVAKYPTATYVGKLRFVGDKPIAVDGDFTFRGVTRPLILKINQFGCLMHPRLHTEVCGADAQATLKWADYGMNVDIHSGGVDEATLHIQVEALKAG
jgi:polyisoprenoid-binding protein YceI